MSEYEWKCPECGDTCILNDAADTPDEDPTHKICNTCNYDWDVIIELIASGYEWICPKCEHLNKEIEVLENLVCAQCKETFVMSDYHHALP